jgi:hypothetical protein
MAAMTGGKPRPKHGVHVRVVRAMTPEQRLRKAFELGATVRAMTTGTPSLHVFVHCTVPV